MTPVEMIVVRGARYGYQLGGVGSVFMIIGHRLGNVNELVVRCRRGLFEMGKEESLSVILGRRAKCLYDKNIVVCSIYERIGRL